MREAQANTTYLKDYRAPDFHIDLTDLHVDLHEDHALVTSNLAMRRNKEAAPDAPLILHGQELELQKVTIDNNTLSETDYDQDEETLTITKVPDTFTLTCVTRIHPQNNTSLEGLYKSRVMFCTQCEAEGFRKITYYLDRPDVMSLFTTTIEADKEKYPVLLANGNDIARGTSDSDPSRHWVTWEDPFRKPSYLFALVAGDLKSVDGTFTTCSNRDIKLQIFVEEKDLDKCDFAMGALKRAMKWDEDTYGREYDLDIFMIVAVDDFNMGAMENKGLNIFNSACVLANPATTTDAAFQRIEGIVAHEYFHNWSGNRVTCRDWFQLSLKEGFTVFRDSEFSADMHSRAVKRIEDVNFLRNVQFPEDAGPMAHSVRPESYMEISNFYTVTIYEKGAEVVRMQAELLGPDNFRKGTDRYFECFDGQAVTTEDFVSTMEEVLSEEQGENLQQFRRWYTQAGTPVVKVEEEFNAEEGTYTLAFTQSCPPTPGQKEKQPFHIPLKMGLLDTNGNEIPVEEGNTTRVLPLKDSTERFTFTNIKKKPVPSLLRGFSAPIKLKANYTRHDLRFLMSHDTDGFVRWESGQQLALQIVDELLTSRNNGTPLQLDEELITAYRSILNTSLQDPNADKAMLANVLLLPSESYIGEQYDTVDVDGIHEVRQFMRQQLATALSEELAEVFNQNKATTPYAFNGTEVARRALRNVVMNYLLLLEDDQWLTACVHQYEAADNMTDTSAALRALVNQPGNKAQAATEKALADFYQKWQHETLVVDQWLGMQAGANHRDNLPKVEALVDHEAFDIKNPNKVRAVIGTFAAQNLVGFHKPDGSGYRFLAGKISELDKLNPQIAARLLTPLTRWRRFDEARQKLMKAELETLVSSKLSKDTYEVVSKSLE